MSTDVRGRGQRLPRSARRAQLLAAAQEAFVASGYHAAAMDDIADRAGVSKPVLYQHFPGKHDLYLALLDQLAVELEATVRGALASTEDNKQRVFATIAAYFDYVAKDGSAYRLLFESDLVNDEAVGGRIDAVMARCSEAFADTISADTAMSRADALVLGHALTGLGQIAARSWLTIGSPTPLSEAARIVGQLAWRGIAGFPKTVEREHPAPA
ncbi:MAG: TetR/AcrR family transcriptional regulator [Dermatophilaceae bacterium]